MKVPKNIIPVLGVTCFAFYALFDRLKTQMGTNKQEIN